MAIISNKQKENGYNNKKNEKGNAWDFRAEYDSFVVVQNRKWVLKKSGSRLVWKILSEKTFGSQKENLRGAVHFKLKAVVCTVAPGKREKGTLKGRM